MKPMWQGIVGHDAVAERFRQTLASGRLASTYLFVGPAGIGKRTFAERLAQTLLCSVPHDFQACGQCESCRLAQAGNHPDLLLVEKPAERSYIPVETFIGPKDKRMREGLCHDIGLKPYLGQRKCAVIDDADYLNVEGANALLKTLEEPPPGSVLMLIGTSVSRQLPTIRSRCQTVRFRPLSNDQVAQVLRSTGAATVDNAAQQLSQSSDGSVRRALELADPEIAEFRRRLVELLSSQPVDSLRIADAVSAMVDAAGKEASARRACLRQTVHFATDFYRNAMRQACGAPVAGDSTKCQPLDAGTATACLDRCLLALEQVDRNANQATLIGCWFDDLETLTT